MRTKRQVILALATLAGVGCLLLSASAQAQITGTAHDFSGQAWNVNHDLCQVCHTPHNANAVPDAPLWNHALTQVQAFTLYDSPSLDAFPGQPTGPSRLCLSCHDGTVSIDAYGSSQGTNVFVTGPEMIGTDLRTSHPVSFTYDAALANRDRELYNPTTRVAPLPGNPTVARALLYGMDHNRMECSTCHDVHDNSANLISGTWYGGSPFLRITNVRSALCLVCHDK